MLACVNQTSFLGGSEVECCLAGNNAMQLVELCVHLVTVLAAWDFSCQSVVIENLLRCQCFDGATVE